jgi:hypothetical protein
MPKTLNTQAILSHRFSVAPMMDWRKATVISGL